MMICSSLSIFRWLAPNIMSGLWPAPHGLFVTEVNKLLSMYISRSRSEHEVARTWPIRRKPAVQPDAEKDVLPAENLAFSSQLRIKPSAIWACIAKSGRDANHVEAPRNLKASPDSQLNR